MTAPAGGMAVTVRRARRSPNRWVVYGPTTRRIGRGWRVDTTMRYERRDERMILPPDDQRPDGAEHARFDLNAAGWENGS